MAAGNPWYRMDNASFLYSAIQREDYSAIYRFSAYMDAEVDANALQRAVDRAMVRFPGFAVRIKRGAFWYYFEGNDAPGPFVREDSADVCRPVRFKEDDGWLVRFLYYGRRISIEVFHALADGTGALTFFRALLAEYLRQCGEEVPKSCAVDLDEEPRAEELEDAYLRYCGREKRKFASVKRAYQNLGTPESFYTFHVTMGFVSISELKRVARAHGGTVTEYLAAVMMKILLDKQKRERTYRPKCVALAVPIDLRAFFPSETLRNFIITAQVSADPTLGEYSVDELVVMVQSQIRLYATPQNLRAVISRGVKLTQSPLLQIIPAPLKSPIMHYSYIKSGVKPYSATFTNPGYFKAEEPIARHIEHMEVVLGQAAVARPHISAIGFGDTLEITVSGTGRETDLERELFRHLVREGLHVRVESNRT